MNIPDGMPVLSAGAHSGPSEGACIMEYASVIAGEEWSDTPACTHPVLTLVAQKVNDDLSDADRHLLLPLLPRLMGTSAGKDDPALSVRLAVWAARRVAHLNTDPRVTAAIKSAEAWALDPTSDATPVAAAAARANDCTRGFIAPDAQAVAYAAAFAARSAAYAYVSPARSAAYVSASTYASHSAAYAVQTITKAERVEFLADLITEYDRLTGRTEHPTVTEADLRRCAELTA